MIGTTLGDYKVLDEIGRGGFARVYLARDRRTNEVVALKVLRTEYTEDAEFIARFQQEADALQKLPRNPHIVALHGFGEQNGTYYIAMEYLEGHDLRNVIQRRGPLPVETATSITAQVAEALAVALAGGVVHRDVKPANVKINPQGIAKIMDFGIARAAEGTRLTRTGLFVGTPAYIAPEIWEGQQASSQSDVYALGVMLYEMLAGKAPFEATTPAATMRKHLLEPPPPLASVRPDVPKWLIEVVERSLAKDLAQRYRDAGELLAALRSHARVESQVDVTTLVTPAASARARQTPPGTLRHTPSGSVARPSSKAMATRPVSGPVAPPADRRQPDRTMKAVLALAGMFGILLVALIGLAIASSRGVNIPFVASKPTDTATPIPTTVTLQPTLTASLTPTATPVPASDTPPPSRTPTALPSATPTPGETPTPRITSTATSTPKPTATAGPTQPAPTTRPGTLFDFESGVNWQRGNEPNGTLTQSTQQAHSDQASARLDYNFPSGGNDYVVFLKSTSLSSQPNAVAAWVYGDGSGHFFNAWIKDSGGQVWQVPMGRVGGAGWRQMVGYIVTGQKWPWTHISGPDNGQVDYPIQFQALVLDDYPDTYSGSGTIYIDDVTVWRTDKGLPTPVAGAPTAQPGPTQPAPATPGPSPTVANEPRAVTLYSPINGSFFKESVITFKWSGGALQPGETFQVEVIPYHVVKSGECTEEYGSSGRQYSPPLTDHEWMTDINNRPPGKLLPCAGRIEWVVHVKDANGNVIQTTPRFYFEWNPLGSQ